MKGLTQIQLIALSDCLLKLSSREVPVPSFFGYIHRAVCDEVKIKVDKKLAAGTMPKNGVTISLSRAQYIFLMDVNRSQLLSHEVEFRNGLTRLLQYNQKKL